MKHLNNIRGWRNNNPGNIRHKDEWVGLRVIQNDDAFCQFVSPEFGIRAMARTLKNYHRKHGLNTLRGIINRWAPPCENNTDAYILSVSHRMGQPADQPYPVGIDHILNPLIKAIIHHELGCQPYSDWLVDTGINWEDPKNTHSIR